MPSTLLAEGGDTPSAPSPFLPLLTGLSMTDSRKMDELLAAKKAAGDKKQELSDDRSAHQIKYNEKESMLLAKIEFLKKICTVKRSDNCRLGKVVDLHITAVEAAVGDDERREAMSRLDGASRDSRDAAKALSDTERDVRSANDELYNFWADMRLQMRKSDEEFRNTTRDEDDLNLAVQLLGFLLKLRNSNPTMFTDHFAFGMLGRDEELKHAMPLLQTAAGTSVKE